MIPVIFLLLGLLATLIGLVINCLALLIIGGIDLFLVLIFGLILHISKTRILVNYVNNIYHAKEEKVINQQEADICINNIKQHLVVFYPTFEKDIIDKVFSSDTITSSSNITIKLQQYPELKTDNVLVTYTEMFNKAQSKIFGCDRDLIRYKKYLRDLVATARFSTLFLRPMPEDIDLKTK
jgi:hypothetical protein